MGLIFLKICFKVFIFPRTGVGAWEKEAQYATVKYFYHVSCTMYKNWAWIRDGEGTGRVKTRWGRPR